MTTELLPQSPAVAPGDRVRALTLAAGAALWAVGNLLHPLTHSEAAEHAPTWAAAHITFSIGAVLLAVGLPALTRSIRRPGGGRAGVLLTAAHGLLFAGLVVLIPVSAYHEVFVSTHLDHHAQTEIATASEALLAPLAMAVLLGFLLFAVYAFARPAPVWGPASGALVLAGTVSMGVTAIAPGVLPGAEGWWIIPGTVAQGLAFGIAGARLAG
ncbi:hypothetical protein ACWEVD_02905 [Nocardia thailandica]